MPNNYKPSYEYQVGGSLKIHAPSYIVRQADQELYDALINGEFCYVFNARQMGKSSLRVQMKHRLQQAGFACASIDITNIGSETITPQQWYKGIASELWRSLNLLSKVNFRHWWQEQAELSSVQQLSRFIEDLLLIEVPREKIFIFIDEIDSVLSLDFPLDDFFALIRYCYNQRAENPKYHRLTFALFGVATPSDLINDRNRTPFNIGRAIELHGFQASETLPLAIGLETVMTNPQQLLAEVLSWTDGQPFLTQKLCQLVVQSMGSRENSSPIPYSLLSIPSLIQQIVQKQIINNWEAADEPEHLKTIRNRLLRNEQQTGGLLSVYQQILQQGSVPADDSAEQVELLLSGLVVKSEGKLSVSNRIYQVVFNLQWVEKQLSKLRPYAEMLNAWLKSDYQDKSRLLSGQALKDAQAWVKGKSLSNLDYQFLSKSEEFDRQNAQQALEAERIKEVEARLEQEQKNVRLQRILLGIVIIAFFISVSLGLAALWQYRKSKLSEIEAIATSSDSLFATNKHLEALVQAIKAKRLLQNLGGADSEVEARVTTVLLQAVYGADEYNRFPGGWGVAFSPDGNLIVTSPNQMIRLWKRDGTLVRTFSEQDSGVRNVGFSPDGKLIASSSGDKTVKVWTLEGKVFSILKGHNAGVWEVVFSPDGKLLATASDDRTVKLWRPDGTLVQTLRGHRAGVRGVAFTPDGQLLASASEDKTIKLWRLDDRIGAVLKQTLVGYQSPVQGVAFSRNGQTLASAIGDKTIKLWHQDSTDKFEYHPHATLIGHSAPVYKVAFSPDDQLIASVSWDLTVKLWSQTGTLLQTFNGHTARVWGVAFSPDGQSLASGSEDSAMRLWRLHNPESVTLNDHRTNVLASNFSPDGHMIASGSDDSTIKLWKSDGTLISTLKGHKAGVLGLAFSPDAQTLASGSWDSQIKLWRIDVKSGHYGLIRSINGHNGAVWKVAYSPDGQLIASASLDGTVKLWAKDGRLLQTLAGHSKEVRDVSFSRDGQVIASASSDKTIKLWRRDGTLLRTLKGNTQSVYAIALSPDGQLIASGGFDKTIKIWTIDGTLLKTLKGHSAEVRRLAFSPDGKFLASASGDKTIKLWKADGAELATLKGHSNAVWNVAFSPDGKRLVSASEDSTVRIWNLNLALHPDQLLIHGCDWVRDYLRTNADLEESDRHICDGEA
jgi:WD40 repeat protein